MLKNMSNTIHKEILSEKQLELLDVVKRFCSDGFYLVGGTALALQLGHRKSIDFDLFKNSKVDSSRVLRTLLNMGVDQDEIEVLIDTVDEYTIFVKGVKFTFLYYPFDISSCVEFENICMATPLGISAMKAYALGRRGKWKDYVDLYVIFQSISYEEVLSHTVNMFGSLFSEKMFLQQLCYFGDLDRTEEIVWLGEMVRDSEIEEFLADLSMVKSSS